MTKVTEAVTALINAKIAFLSEMENLVIGTLPHPMNCIVTEALDRDEDALEPTNAILVALLECTENAHAQILDGTADDPYEAARSAIENAAAAICAVVAKGQGNVIPLSRRER